MTAPTKSRSFIVQVDNLQDLFEKFDARMGHTQWERYLTQLPGWETARDQEGRTLLMIGFGSTKGRNPDFYLRSAVADSLVARDNSGRNLWNYAYANRTTLGGDNGAAWERVFKQVPFQVNPVSGHGILTDMLLNSLPLHSRPGNEKKNNATSVLPRFPSELESEASQRKSGTFRLLQWAGQGAEKWWGCPAEQEQDLFNALIFRTPWQNWSNNNASLRQLFTKTLGRDESPDDIPAPFHAFATVAQIIKAPASDCTTAMKAIRDGQLEPFIAHQHDRFFKHLLKGREDILKRERFYNQKTPRVDILEVMAEARQARFEQRLERPENVATLKPRL